VIDKQMGATLLPPLKYSDHPDYPAVKWTDQDMSAIKRYALAALVAQSAAPNLRALVEKVNKAKGRYHSQIAWCDLYDACGLKNYRPDLPIAKDLNHD
jgi:stalled ribosome alternative rescue factor ArfA